MSKVEWKNVEDSIISLRTGLNPRQNFKLNLPGYSLPYITGKDIYNNRVNVSSNTDKIDSKAVSLINKRACLEKDLLLFASTGTGTVGRMAIIDSYNNDWAISETLYAIKTSVELTPKFLMYVLYSDVARKQFEPKISKGSVPHLKIADLLKVNIPIPSLAKQNWIVKILDTFTLSIENLKEQIAQRRKQYEHYRDHIIKRAFISYQKLKLKDVAVIKNGKDYKELGGGSIPVYGSGGIMTYVDKYASNKPSVLLPRKGSVDNIFYVEEPFWTVDTIYWTDIDESIIVPKYLFYSLSTYSLKDFAYGGARPSLSQPILYKLSIPVPALSNQQRIVDILDKFEASIQNLEAQLSLREKQYEYYRNKLLTFE